MVFKNLFRRKGRTILILLGISIGVAAIVALGAVAREIGFLRSLGWRRRRVLGLILGESVVLALLGGLVGSGLGVVAVFMVSRSGSWLGVFGSQLTPDLPLRSALLRMLVYPKFAPPSANRCLM